MEITSLNKIALSFDTKAVIFDCFGTIMEISQKQQPYRFLIKYLEAQGYKNKDFPYWIMSRSASLEDIEKISGIKIDTQAKIDFQNLLQKDLNSVVPYPEVNKFLGDLKRSQIKTMLCSNLASTYGSVAKTKTISLDYYVLSYEVGYLKPEPQIFQLCQDKLQLKKNEIIFVGDTYKDDYLGAKNFGFQSFWLKREK